MKAPPPQRPLGTPSHAPNDSDPFDDAALAVRATDRDALDAPLARVITVQNLHFEPPAAHAALHFADDHRASELGHWPAANYRLSGASSMPQKNSAASCGVSFPFPLAPPLYMVDMPIASRNIIWPSSLTLTASFMLLVELGSLL